MTSETKGVIGDEQVSSLQPITVPGHAFWYTYSLVS